MAKRSSMKSLFDKKLLPLSMSTIDEVNEARSLEWSPDGCFLAVLSKPYQSVKLFDIRLKEFVQKIATDHTFWSIRFVTWSPDGNTLACPCDNKVVLFDPKTGDKITTRRISDSSIQAGAWFPNGKGMVLTDTYRILIWDQEEDELKKIEVEARVRSLALSADGNFLAIGTDWGGIKVLDFKRGTIISVFKHKNSLLFGRFMEWSPSGNILASCSGGAIKLWDMKEAKLIKTIPIHGSPESLVWIDSYTLAYNEDDLISLYDTRNLTSVGCIRSRTKPRRLDFDIPRCFQKQSRTKAMAWSAATQTLALGGTDKSIELYSLYCFIHRTLNNIALPTVSNGPTYIAKGLTLPVAILHLRYIRFVFH